ncbi:Hypothetical protein CINCED_3A004050 [Cinara cedri]|uniref:Uncharacterized protein n=1 Tax=Cinara cedri TaxID=506608 RepID=A0A5E4N9G1_9HEMI|nr:Hypothetical protein CINCED_3A004050 [Cinara cedri]
MWTWRIMMKISWIENKSNMEVLNMINTPRPIIKIMKMRKTKFFGHMMRHDTIITNIMERKINGNRGRIRPRETNLGNIMKLLPLVSYEEVKRLEDQRKNWLQRKGEAIRQ